MAHVRIALAAATLVAVAAAPSLPVSAASHAATSAPSRFAGLTTFAAAHSGRAVVRLARPVPVRMADHGRVAGLTFHGGGRIVGVVVTAADGRAGIAQFRMRTCFTAGCRRSVLDDRDEYMGFTWGGSPQFGPSDPPLRLGPGLYQVSVYADGAPLRVSLHLPGLAGRSHVAVHLPQRADVESPTEQGVGGTPATPAWTQSLADYTLRTDIVVLAAIHRVRGGPHVDSQSVWCIYQGAGPPQGLVTPDCDGGSGIGFAAAYVSRSTDHGAWGMTLAIGSGSSGHYFQGGNETGVQVAADVHDTFFWGDAGIPSQP